jgi:Skp family chaperone for outer membrane proteins
VRSADLVGMVMTRSIPPQLVLLLGVAAFLALPGGAAAAPADARGPRAPVAYYDIDAVLRAPSVFASERARLVRLTDRYESEAAALRREVHALRAQVMHDRALPEAERRDLEARLAQRTIALLVARTEDARELARARIELLERIERRIVPAVARIARERGLVVVVRADADTVVLDEDALDLTGFVVDALDDGAADGVEPASPSERRRTRLQSCDDGAGADGTPPLR